jgi:predicted double-glycine peptidase
MLLEFNKEGEVLRAQYIDPFTTHATVPETFQAQLQSVYPKARFQTLTLLQQSDNNSCGAYTIENLLMAALGIRSPKERESIRLMHLECLREYNPDFLPGF